MDILKDIDNNRKNLYSLNMEHKPTLPLEDSQKLFDLFQKEDIRELWYLLKFKWHDTQNQPNTEEFLKDLHSFSKDRKNNIPCCS